MKRNTAHSLLAVMSLALLFYVVVIHLRFVVLPVLFLALGTLTYLWNGRKALGLFLFLLPLIHSTPDIFFNGYPYNYMGVSLFYLSGIMIASRLRKEKPEFAFPGYGPYLLFLALVAVSVFFVFLRWSNLTFPSLAFLRDTPVAPSGDRLSFACIFPVITMALFSLTPFLMFLIRHWRFKENEVFVPLKAGFCLSFLVAMIQKWLDPGFLAQSWWKLKMDQVNGGFSDFNAFGFFAGVMFLYQFLSLAEKLPARDDRAAGQLRRPVGFLPVEGRGSSWSGIAFLLVALAAIFISGSRTAFLFVLLTLIYFVLSGKFGWGPKAAVILLMFISLLLAGGTLKKRLQQTTRQTAHLAVSGNRLAALDHISNGRLTMLLDSAKMLGRSPVSGIGAGNFLFYLKTLHYADDAYLDLPLNQYTLILSELGMVAGLAFIFFLGAAWKRQQTGMVRFVILAIAVALLFNNFFWFPECLLLFWIFLAVGSPGGAPGRAAASHLWLCVLIVAIVAAFHVLTLRDLHPETLVRQKGVAYDYGFWPPEENERGLFSWTSDAAGKYVPAAAGRDFAIGCDAPPGWLQQEKPEVELFWRGKRLLRAVLHESQVKKFRLPSGQEGFLEIRVYPTFNIRSMKLGADPRQLGVQFMELKPPT